MPGATRAHRRLHIALPGNRAVPVVATFGDVDGLRAIRAALPGAAAAFAERIERSEAPNRTPGALESARTVRRDGFRITYWLQKTEATFCVVVVTDDADRKGFSPTPQTLYVVAERDATAPQQLSTMPEEEDGILPGRGDVNGR